MIKRIGPKRGKGGIGFVGMGVGSLIQGGGSITRKIPSTKSVQKHRDRVCAKSVKLEREAASFASTTRAVRTKSKDE